MEAGTASSHAALCPWCLMSTSHTVIQANSLRRNVYACNCCGGRTLGCLSCAANMTFGGDGWDDKLCFRCAGTLSEKELLRRRHIVLSSGWDIRDARSRMSATCPERSSAAASGMLRPFLLLLSMTPGARLRVSAALGVCLSTSEAWGDPAAEAWHLLHAPLVGLQARATPTRESLSIHAPYPTW